MSKNRLRINISVTVTQTERDWKNYAEGNSDMTIEIPVDAGNIPNVDVQSMIFAALNEWQKAQFAIDNPEPDPEPEKE